MTEDHSIRLAVRAAILDVAELALEAVFETVAPEERHDVQRTIDAFRDKRKEKEW